ncbi:MAG: N-acetylmuramoyl-L-alanine amidase [Syntrophomonas sp.]
MQIRRYQLVFKKLKKRRGTERIIVHHSASPDVPVTEIHRWHLNRGWSGVGYHYVVRADGTIEEGRPLCAIGAHSGPQGNVDSIGVCLTGNFMESAPGMVQIEALVLLINYLWDFYSRELAVIGHKDVMATACPGECFPWELLFSRLGDKEADIMSEEWKMEIMARARKEGLITADHQPDEPAPKWFVLAAALNILERLEANRNGN